jgi:uncharacterized membrane protein (UPF0127 family)
MTRKHKNPDADRMLNTSDLSRVYRAGADEQPPARLDAAILAQARKAVGASRSHGPFSGWTAPLSAAAVIVLSVVLVVFMSREAPLHEQTVAVNAPTELETANRVEKAARDEEPPSAKARVAPSPSPIAQAPLADQFEQKKKEERADATTSAAPATAIHERASGEAAAGARAPTMAQEENRSARLLAKQALARVVDLRLGNVVVRAELAATNAELQRGLMHRDSLAPNTGMLFLFPPRWNQVCMWMKDTRIPLSAAFLDRAGTIVKIADMQPFSQTVHCAEGDIRFVLEMNQGAFAAAGLKQGMRIDGLPPLQD